MSKTVCGVTVDSKKYEEVIKKSYMVGGISVDFSLVELGMAVLEGKESARGFTKNPAFCENCKKIYDRVKSELISYNRAKGLNEEGKAINNITEGDFGTMKHSNFKSIFEELKGIYASGGEKEKALAAEWEAVRNVWKKAKENTAPNSKDRVLAESDYIRAEEKYKNERAALARDIEGRVAELRATLKEATANHYRVKPGKVDNATLELLRLGVFKDSDMVRLTEDYAGNPTMLTVIKKYAEDKEDSKEMHELSCKITDMLDDSKEIDSFDALCKYANRSYEIDPVQRTTYHDLFDDLFDKMFDDAISNASDNPFDGVEVSVSDEDVAEGE